MWFAGHCSIPGTSLSSDKQATVALAWSAVFDSSQDKTTRFLTWKQAAACDGSPAAECCTKVEGDARSAFYGWCRSTRANLKEESSLMTTLERRRLLKCDSWMMVWVDGQRWKSNSQLGSSDKVWKVLFFSPGLTEGERRKKVAAAARCVCWLLAAWEVFLR